MKKRKVRNITEEEKNSCNKIIHSFSVAAGGVGTGLAQIPLADNAVITPIQISMIIALGKVFEQDISKSAAQAIISGAGASLIGRGISQVAFGWIPGIGNAVNTATAAGLTEAIGWLAVSQFADSKSKNKMSSTETKKEEVNMVSESHTTEEVKANIRRMIAVLETVAKEREIDENKSRSDMPHEKGKHSAPIDPLIKKVMVFVGENRAKSVNENTEEYYDIKEEVEERMKTMTTHDEKYLLFSDFIDLDDDVKINK